MRPAPVYGLGTFGMVVGAATQPGPPDAITGRASGAVSLAPLNVTYSATAGADVPAQAAYVNCPLEFTIGADARAQAVSDARTRIASA